MASTTDGAATTGWRWTKFRILGICLVVGAGVALALGAAFTTVAVAAAIAYGTFWIGWAILGSFARPIPAPPPPGELRRVRLQYRCSICGAEMRMTAAADDDPEPPRHCQEDMDLVAPTYD